jgi:lipopolysaccharide/colanic/teichoic acid biosynthesis glycosyltransferase
MKGSAVGRFVALVACCAGFPFHLLACISIKLADGGAAIYRDKRVGRLERPFLMLKYRSMKVDCKPLVRAGSKFIVEANDPRVTPLGRVLRCGIDELPQLANIVRGEMGWVGPRPLPVSVLSKYGPVIRERFQLLPGITGLAQVLHSRSCSSARALAIDIWYLGHRTPWLDLWVIAATPLFICGWKSVGKRRLDRLLQMPEFCEVEGRCQEELGPGVGLLAPALASAG